MKKILVSFIIGGFVFSSSTPYAFAAVSDLTLSAKDTLYHNAPYTLSWKGTTTASTTYPIYLMGGTLKKGKFLQLGTTTMDQQFFQFTLNTKIKTGSKYVIAFGSTTSDSLRTAEFKIRKEKDNPANKNKINLTKPNKGTLTQGKKNKISWKGGTEKVIVGIQTKKGAFVGWISANEKPKSSMTWDAKKVCKIDMKTCWNIKVSDKGDSFKILVVSKDQNGTYSATTTGNMDMSDKAFKIKPPKAKKSSSSSATTNTTTGTGTGGTQTPYGTINSSQYDYLYENTLNYYNSVLNPTGASTQRSQGIGVSRGGIPNYFTAGGFNTYTISSFGVNGGAFSVDTQFVIFESQLDEIQQTGTVAQ